MSFNSRRNFIKKTALTSAFASSGIKLFSAENGIPDFPKTDDADFWKNLRNQFYLSNDKIYFNTASLGASPKSVVNALNEWTIKLETSGETGHEHGIETNKKIAQLLNCDVSEIAITRNTTESINSIAHSLPLNKGDEVIMTKDEHVGGAQPWVALMKEKGISIKLVDLDYSGENNFEVFKKAISGKTKAVMFSHVTCSTGMILPAKEIVDLCRSKNIYTCVDGAQAVGMIDVNLKEINPDFYAGSGHKWLFGPKGTGILFINKNLLPQLNPVYVGAYSDKKFDLNNLELEFVQTAQREEYGTRNTALTMAFGESIDFINKIGIKKIEERGKQLASYFKSELQQNKNIELLTPVNDKHSGSIVTFKIKGKDYKQIQNELQQKHSFRLRGIYENKLDALRISCSIINSENEINQLVAVIEKL